MTEHQLQIALDERDPTQAIVCVRAPVEAPTLRLGQFLKAIDVVDGRVHVMRVTAGPFFNSDRRVSQEAADATYRANLVGTLEKDCFVQIPSGRPRPGAAVEILAAEHVASAVFESADILLGVLDSEPAITVGLDSKAKHVLPRNVGIFGTVGSGKSNTTQVLIEEAAAAGWAVVVVDVEGEYTRVGMPAKKRASSAAERVRPAAGIKDVNVLLPAPAGARKGARSFSIPVSAFPADLLCALLEASEAQRRMLQDVVRELGQEYDITELLAAAEEANIIDRRQSISRDVLFTRLRQLAESGLFFSRKPKSVAAIDPSELAVAGRVSVVDVSDLSDRPRNLILGYLLQSLFALVEERALGEKLKTGPRPPVMIVMEELQTFFSSSDESTDTVLSFLQDVARRGRKRWLSLVAVSQQPSALPPRLFELFNTRIIHQTRSEANLSVLRRTCGDISDGLWDRVTSFDPGMALLAAPGLKHAEVVRMRPASSERTMTN